MSLYGDYLADQVFGSQPSCLDKWAHDRDSCTFTIRIVSNLGRKLLGIQIQNTLGTITFITIFL
jgi:hypothetical protein